MKKFIDKIYPFIVILVIVLIIAIYYKTRTPEASWGLVSSKDEEIELLKEEISNLEDELSDVSSKCDELERKNKDNEDLIEILQDQLLSHGIEPDEL